MAKKQYALDSRYAWFVWALGAAFFLIEYIARVAPSVMVNELLSTFHISGASLGAFSALFYYAYIAMQIPAGAIMDKFGPHKLLTVTTLLCSLGCVLYGTADNLLAAQIGRFLTGFGAAFAFVGTLKLATGWFTPSRFGLLAGATQALGMLGAAFGEGPTALMVNHFGWRTTLLLIAVVLGLLGLLIGLFVKDNANLQDIDFHSHKPSSATKVQPMPLWRSLITAFANPQLWLVSAFAGLLFAPTAAFGEFWGTTYLVNVYGLSKELAATAIGMIFLGWAVGGPIAGCISDNIGKRKPVMLLSSLACLLFMSLVLYCKQLPVGFLFLFLFLYGISNVGVATAYAVSCEISPRRVSGTSMAFTNMASIFLGSAFHPVIGKLLDTRWDGVFTSEGARLFSSASYQEAMVLLPACCLLAFIVGLFVKETHCKTID